MGMDWTIFKNHLSYTWLVKYKGHTHGDGAGMGMDDAVMG